MVDSSRESGDERTYPGSPHWLEWAAAIHVGVLVIATTWAFGGQSETVRLPLSVLASAGAVLTAVGLLLRQANLANRQFRHCLAPLAALSALTLAGSLNPGLREASDQPGTLWLQEVPTWLPSSACPRPAGLSLWSLCAVWLSAFNLLFLVRRRRVLRALLALMAANAVLLAVLGILQKAAGAEGIFLGAVPVPQPRFFATFVYPNHWGAFALMMMGLLSGLGWHYARTVPARDPWQGPLPSFALAGLVVAVTLPLSGSRSCTLAGVALLGAASVRIIVAGRRRGPSARGVWLAALAFWGCLLAAAWQLGGAVIRERLETTELQIAEMRAQGGIGDRALLYGNTWRMALDRPWFGWGMASFPHVFHGFYNTRRPSDGLPAFYHDAHSDWLQAFAEHGIAGTGLLAACGLVPLWHFRRSVRRSRMTTCLFAGLAVVLAYALVEFPFGNRANVLVWWVLFFAGLAYARSDTIPAARATPAAGAT